MKKYFHYSFFIPIIIYVHFVSIIIAGLLSLLFLDGFGQSAPTGLSAVPSGAYWIAHPSAGNHAYGVFHFRKTITLTEKPVKFVINISGDQRFRLFVNGISVAVGAARSDIKHWRYQIVDIGPNLMPGKNTLAAVVWNDGEYSAWAQMSYQTGFLIFGASEKESVANTDSSWKVTENIAITPLSTIAHITGSFMQVLAQRYPWGWQNTGYDDSYWLKPVISEKVIFNNDETITYSQSSVRFLVSNKLPMPEERLQRITTIRKFNGLEKMSDNFLKGAGTMSVHPWASVDILLDQTFLTTAFINLLISGGSGAKITITYAECLIDDKGNKGNRNEIEGKHIHGDYDVIITDGGSNRLFSTLYYRTFRYILLHIENHQQPLEIKDFYGVFTAYPFHLNASFSCDDPVVNNIWNTGWRTARLCAYETYMDCPYYEQMQYVGDTRIQALISLYLSGDDRLMKNAIEQIEYSMLEEGITQSRYPSTNMQIIPSFSLFWISMVHDYWMHKPGDKFIKSKISSIKKIIDWHQRYLDAKGMLGKMPYWNFVDWPKQWPWTGNENESGIPAGAKEGKSSILSLQYVMALQKAAELLKNLGFEKDAASYLKTAYILKDAVHRSCWDASKQLMADSPEKKVFSQHVQALCILTGVIENRKAKALLTKTLADTSLIQCTYYYRFYLLQALKKAGLENEYLSNLLPWKNMLGLGLTTFSEAPEPTRSDCHGWSASPCYDLLATVVGIIPASAGFKSIQVKPAPGNLKYFKASMPHPKGIIKISYQNLADKKCKFFLELPAATTGTFIWKQKQFKLKSGENYFQF